MMAVIKTSAPNKEYTCGELSVKHTLRAHPPHREKRFGLDSVVVRRVDVAGQTEVGNLDSAVLTYQTITSRKIPVYVIVA